MKFAIAVVVPTTVVGVYSNDLIPGVSTVGKGLSVEDLEQIKTIIAGSTGPNAAKLLTELVVSLANGRNPLQDVPDKAKKILGQLFEGGDKNSSKIKNLTPADQKALHTILNRTVGPYTSAYVVRTLALVTNGLLTKIPLNKIIQGVTELTAKL